MILVLFLDKNLTLTCHINETCRKAANAIRSIGRIPKYLTNENLEGLVNALVISRLDCCNSILLPKRELDKLQRAQNTAARLITETKQYHHIKPALYLNLFYISVGIIIFQYNRQLVSSLYFYLL